MAVSAPRRSTWSRASASRWKPTFTFPYVDLVRWAGAEVVAWAQTPASGWGEAYQAAKLSMTLHGDGFESGDFGGGWIVVP